MAHRMGASRTVAIGLVKLTNDHTCSDVEWFEFVLHKSVSTIVYRAVYKYLDGSSVGTSQCLLLLPAVVREGR